MSDECLDEVNERSTYVVTVSFFDENDSPVTPTAASYRLHDQQRKTELLGTTAISPLGTTADIEITPTQNRILRRRAAYEVRTLTLSWDYGVGKSATAQYRYKLLNLYGIDLASVSPSVSPSASSSPST